MKMYVLAIKPVITKNSAYCYKGIAITIESILKISTNLFEKYENLRYINGQKFNQDPIENFFSLIRARNFNKFNPNLFEFSARFAKVLSIKIIFSSQFSNCEEDQDELLNIDWDAVFEAKADSIEEDDPTSANFCLSGSKSLMDVEIPLGNGDEEENNSSDLQLSDVAVRSFAGYCFLKVMKRMKSPCLTCCNEMTKDRSFTDISEIMLKLKQYKFCSEDSGLISPSDKFYDICKRHVKTFSRTFNSTPEAISLKQVILDQCIEDINSYEPNWFSLNNICYQHHLQILDFFVLVLLWKNCKWVSDLRRSRKKKIITKSRKLINLTSS